MNTSRWTRWLKIGLAGALAAPGLAVALTLDEALARLGSYDHGQPNDALKVIEREVGRLSGDAATRPRLAAQLLERLTAPGMPSASRLFLARQLALVAGEAEVPALGRLLADPETVSLACLILRSLPGDAATRVVLEGLRETRGETRLSVIGLAAERGDPEAVGSLAELLADPDRRVAEAAAGALGRIGTRSAAERLATPGLQERLGAVLRTARLEAGWRLARAGHAGEAGRIFREYQGADQPLPVRVAALTGWVEAAGDRAWPELMTAVTTGEPGLAHQAIEWMRRLPDGRGLAGWRQALEETAGERRLLLLSALAGRGEAGALERLLQLTREGDESSRRLAALEVRRLAWSAHDPAIRTGLADAADQLEERVEGLSPMPYGPEEGARRRAEIQAALAEAGNLVAYLDCGAASRVEEGRIVLRQVNGGVWRYPGAERAAPAPLGTVAFEGSELVFEIRGLDPEKRYWAGFGWWDYDGNGRVQTVSLSGGEPRQRIEVLERTRLPAWQGRREGPAFGRVALDPSLTRTGSVRVAFQRRSGPNAVVSELWVAEAGPEGIGNTPVLMTGGETPADGERPVQADLTPPAEGTRVLLVTGNDYPGHPWPETAPLLKRLIEADPRLRVRVVEDPEALGSPRLMEYDVVILHFMDWEVPGPGPAARENLRRFVAGGKGLMLTHFACGAWDGGEWPEFVRLAGRIWDPRLRGHDPHGVFRVDIVEPAHPIMRGIEAFETLDELYTCLAGDTPVQVLAQATSKVDGEDYPMIFVLEYGKGRVFHSVLGHDARAYTHHPAVGELMRRGCAWVAGLDPVRE